MVERKLNYKSKMDVIEVMGKQHITGNPTHDIRGRC